MKTEKQLLIEALEFFHGAGYIENLHGDEKYYTEILMNKVAKVMKIQLT